MATLFDINAATNHIALDSDKRTGNIVFNVTNVSDRVLQARASIKSADANIKSWFAIEGDALRPFPAGAMQQFKVQIAAPPTAAVKDYTFSLLVAEESNPDDNSNEGPQIGLTVPPVIVKPPPPPSYRWIWVVAALVVLAIIVVIALVVRQNGITSAGQTATAVTGQNQTATAVAAQNSTATAVANNMTATAQNQITMFTSARVRHHATSVFDTASGTDTLNNGSSVGSNCTIVFVLLELLDTNDQVLVSAPPGVPASLPSNGFLSATITNDPRGTNNYRTSVDWNVSFGLSLNYQVVYTVRGANCIPPSGTVQQLF